MQRLAIVPRDAIENVALREAVQGSLRVGHELGVISEDEFVEIANTTIDRMTPEQLSLLARASMRVCELLIRTAANRRRTSIIVRSR